MSNGLVIFKIWDACLLVAKQLILLQFCLSFLLTLPMDPTLSQSDWCVLSFSKNRLHQAFQQQQINVHLYVCVPLFLLFYFLNNACTLIIMVKKTRKKRQHKVKRQIRMLNCLKHSIFYAFKYWQWTWRNIRGIATENGTGTTGQTWQSDNEEDAVMTTSDNGRWRHQCWTGRRQRTQLRVKQWQKFEGLWTPITVHNNTLKTQRTG